MVRTLVHYKSVTLQSTHCVRIAQRKRGYIDCNLRNHVLQRLQSVCHTDCKGTQTYRALMDSIMEHQMTVQIQQEVIYYRHHRD